MLKPRRPNNLSKLNNSNQSNGKYFKPESKGKRINNKSILDTHPFIPLRKAISISFFDVSTNLGRNNGIDETFEIKSIKQIKKDYKETILKFVNIFPETKNLPKIEDLEKEIDIWISQVTKHSKVTKETDRMFISFLKEEILNEKSFSFDEKDCIKIIGPAYLILTEIFNQTYDSLKNLYAIKYFESIKGSIQNFKDLR
jgi:hypothetical protein